MASSFFIDSDVILDALLDREPFAANARNIFKLVASREIEVFCSSIIVTNVFYLVKKQFNSNRAYSSIDKLLGYFKVLPVGELEIKNSIKSGFSDFEDGIQHQVALQNPAIKAIVTRNTKDYRLSTIVVITPAELLALFK
ncbi:PIN domain-containing protein [Algoriphagus aquimarinus]|uniref:PIN domain-containing protein n=1 Tax=Algoriphagus aquimarinus TaxID=237018 RepID=A0A1I1BDE8_9BACT|nr:PIN domain-containing protein [Algoriphagus aquimarinus]SFB47656.1 PIN domain-containing protein [Algoriphagus aquimarinus]